MTWINASWKWPRGSLAMVERLTFSLWGGRRCKCPHDARPDQMRSDSKPCIPSQFISKQLNLINTSRWGRRTLTWTWEEVLICQWRITLYWLCEVSPPLPRIITEFCRVLSRMTGSRRLDEATSDHWWLIARDGAGPDGYKIQDTKTWGGLLSPDSWLCLCRAGPEVRLLQCCSAADRDRKPHFWQQLYILRWHLDRA